MRWWWWRCIQIVLRYLPRFPALTWHRINLTRHTVKHTQKQNACKRYMEMAWSSTVILQLYCLLTGDAAFVDRFSHAFGPILTAKCVVNNECTHFAYKAHSFTRLRSMLILFTFDDWRQLFLPSRVVIIPFNCRPIFFSRGYAIFVWHILFAHKVAFLSRSPFLLPPPLPVSHSLSSFFSFFAWGCLFGLEHSVYMTPLFPSIFFFHARLSHELLFTSAKRTEFQRITWLGFYYGAVDKIKTYCG